MENNTFSIVLHWIAVFLREMNWFPSIIALFEFSNDRPDFETVIPCCGRDEHSIALGHFLHI